jgi:succinoglycan biosynthesis protein ExoA
MPQADSAGTALKRSSSTQSLLSVAESQAIETIDRGDIIQAARKSVGRGANVLIVIPTLNEEANIGDIIRSLQSDTGCPEALIVLADGGSRDATVPIVADIAETDARIITLNTSPLGVSGSINRAVERFGHGRDWLVRIDAHASYPANYASRLVETAVKRGATAVVTSMLSRGTTCFQQAAAASQNSFLGTGGSAHRMSGGEGAWVEHGHHALISMKAFIVTGGYDESFTHNEDAELDHRLLNAGCRIWLEPNLGLVYYPRKDLPSLCKQYFRYGAGRAKTVSRHPRRRRARQVIPLTIAPICFLALFAPADWQASVPALLWSAVCLIYGLVLGMRQGRCATGAGIAAMAMQATWSFGYWKQRLAGSRPGGSPERLRLIEFGEAKDQERSVPAGVFPSS